MNSTRRQFLLGSIAMLSFFSGCTRFIGDTADEPSPIDDLVVELANMADDSHIFHFAIETSEGLDNWQSHEVNAQTRESVRPDISEGYKPVAIHGVVDDQTASTELLGRSVDMSEKVCLPIVVKYETSGTLSFWLNDDLCDFGAV